MSSKGFTLVEIIIVAGIALVLGVMLTAILVNNSGMFYQESSTVASGISLNDVIDEISTDVKQASDIAPTYPETSPVYTSNAQTLILKLPALTANGTLPEVFDYLVISKDASNPKVLRKQVFPDPQSTRTSSTLVLTAILDEVTFEFLDKNGNSVSPAAAASVGTTLKLISKTGSIGTAKSASTVITLRNAQ